MATTKIWDVRGRLDKVISYAANPEKTAGPTFGREDLQSLRDVMNYAVNDYKTEQQLYVTGLNCVPEFAREQMQETKRRWHKEGGITHRNSKRIMYPAIPSDIIRLTLAAHWSTP